MTVSIELDSILTALADPHRRRVVDLLAQRPQSAGALAASVGLTPPAMSRHLRVLRRSGLVQEHSHADDARVRIYSLRPEPFVDLNDWLDDVRQFWTDQLGAFKDHVESRGEPMTPNSVSVSTLVRTSPDTAFTLFTNEIDTWWRRSARHRSRPAASIVRFDGDSLVEVSGDGSTELGRVLAWEPGSRLVLAWLGPHWAPAERTEVEITFEPDGDGTRVTVEHRGWTAVQTGDAAAAVIGLWWGDLLAGYTFRAARHAGQPAQR